MTSTCSPTLVCLTVPCESGVFQLKSRESFQAIFAVNFRGVRSSEHERDKNGSLHESCLHRPPLPLIHFSPNLCHAESRFCKLYGPEERNEIIPSFRALKSERTFSTL
jgi:hypothetical protein